MRQPNWDPLLNDLPDVPRGSLAVLITFSSRPRPLHDKTTVEPDKVADPRRTKQIRTNANLGGPASVVQQRHIHKRGIKHNVSVVAQKQHATIHGVWSGVPGDALCGMAHETLQERLHHLRLKARGVRNFDPALCEASGIFFGDHPTQITRPIARHPQSFQRGCRLRTLERRHVCKF